MCFEVWWLLKKGGTPLQSNRCIENVGLFRIDRMIFVWPTHIATGRDLNQVIIKGVCITIKVASAVTQTKFLNSSRDWGPVFVRVLLWVPTCDQEGMLSFMRRS